MREVPGGAQQTEAEPLPPPSSKSRGGANKPKYKRSARHAAAATDSATASIDTTTSAKTILSGKTGVAALGEAGFGSEIARKEHLAGGATGADDSRGRKIASRIARLARIRRKMAPLGPLQRQPGTASSPEIELRAIAFVSQSPASACASPAAARASPAMTASDDVRASVSPHKRELLALVLVPSALVLVCILWALSDIVIARREGINYFIKMDCNRIGSFRPAAVLVMTGFLFTALFLRPKKLVDASITHRTLFSKVGLFLVCMYAVAAASIGYPQGLCDDSCSCGMCAGFKTPISDGPPQNRTKCSTREVYLNSTNAGSADSVFATCAKGEAVEPAEPCSFKKTDPPRGNRIVLGTNITGKISASRLAETIDMLADYVSINGKVSFPKAEESCKEAPPETLQCPNWAHTNDESLAMNVVVPFLPITCESFYGYCDKENALRPACPQTACCRICNMMLSLTFCTDPKSRKYIDDALDGTNLEYRLQDNLRVGMFLGLPPAFLAKFETVIAWYARTLSTLRNESMADGGNYTHRVCSMQCEEHAWQTQLYAHDSDCLKNSERSWDLSDENPESSGNVKINRDDASQSEVCSCDVHALAWSKSIVLLEGITCIVSVAFMVLQIWVAVKCDGEEIYSTLVATTRCHCGHHVVRGGRNPAFRRCFSAKEQILTSAVCVFLVICLVRQLDTIVSASKGTTCFSQDSHRLPTVDVSGLANDNLMKSWLLLHIAMLYIIFEVFSMSVVRWLLRRDFASAEATDRLSFLSDDGSGNVPDRPPTIRQGNQHACFRQSLCIRKCSKKTKSCFNMARDIESAIDDMLSFERGRWYIYLVLSLEIFEVANQASQLISFSHERPFEWIVALSGLLVLNGLCIPIPFLLGRWIPGCEKETKLLLAGTDATFDVMYLLVAILYSEKASFAGGTWLVASLGVAIPLVGIVRVIRDISEAARNKISSNEWRKDFGLERPRRRSSIMVKLQQAETKGDDSDHRSSNRGAFAISFLIGAFCVGFGASFLNMANQGDRLCRQLLGSALWEGSDPRIVFTRSGRNDVPRAGCNFREIRSIMSRADASTGILPIVRIPLALSRLAALESLVLSRHNIASDGVPAQILDGIALPKLTRLEFGVDDPVTRHLDLTESGVYLDSFPRYVLEFMTELETLRLDGTNVSCFPPRATFSSLERLRQLNLSGTSIDYVPPSVLFDHPQTVALDLSETPVSRTLDWSEHGLGDVYGFAWDRLTETLPLLSSLNISSNDLDDITAIDLSSLPNLQVLDVSHNPALTPRRSSSFSWWKNLSEHPSLNSSEAVFIGLANVGLGPQHMKLRSDSTTYNGELTCRQLQWLDGILSTKSIQIDRVVPRDVLLEASVYSGLDISKNSAFEVFVQWAEIRRADMKCICESGLNCLYLDRAIYYSLSQIIPAVKSIVMGDVFQKNINRFLPDISQGWILGLLSSNVTSVTLSHVPTDKGQQIIPKSIGRLVNLRVLILKSGQRLPKQASWGGIPEEIFTLTKLEKLQLVRLGLSGPVPAAISSLRKVRELRLDSNNLNGPIPSEIAKLKAMRRMWLNYNELNGSIPPAISQLAFLSALRVNNNRLSGSIPAAVSALTNMKELRISDNPHLSGPIPSELVSLTAMADLDISKTGVSKPFPARIGSCCMFNDSGVYDCTATCWDP